MPKQSNNQLVLGGAAGLVIVAIVWFFVRSGSAGETYSPNPQPTITLTEDEPAEAVARSEPRGSTGGARLGAAPVAVEDEDDEEGTQQSKKKRNKKRQRKKQEREEEEEEKTGAKKGKKERYFGK